jgi:hypothetical protein
VKSRLVWIAVIVAALVGFYVTSVRPLLAPATTNLNQRLTREYRPPEIPLPPLPEPKIETPTIPLPPPSAIRVPPPAAPAARTAEARGLDVPIQHGATIDFSLGAPIVRSQGADKEALDKALKEMAEATKDVQFAPTPAKKP